MTRYKGLVSIIALLPSMQERRLEPNTSMWPGLAIAAAPPPETKSSLDSKEENSLIAERLKEKKEPRLSDFNPLLYPPELLNPEAMAVFKTAIREKINQYGGLQPVILESLIVFNEAQQKHEPRLVARFETDQFTEEQTVILEELVEKTYGTVVKTRRGKTGARIKPIFYPVLEQGKVGKNVRTASSRLLG